MLFLFVFLSQSPSPSPYYGSVILSVCTLRCPVHCSRSFLTHHLPTRFSQFSSTRKKRKNPSSPHCASKTILATQTSLLDLHFQRGPFRNDLTWPSHTLLRRDGAAHGRELGFRHYIRVNFFQGCPEHSGWGCN